MLVLKFEICCNWNCDGRNCSLTSTCQDGGSIFFAFANYAKIRSFVLKVLFCVEVTIMLVVCFLNCCNFTQFYHRVYRIGIGSAYLLLQHTLRWIRANKLSISCLFTRFSLLLRCLVHVICCLCNMEKLQKACFHNRAIFSVII